MSTPPNIYWRDARQINMQDHDDACEIVRWCGGRALGEEHGPYAIEVPGPNGPQYAKDGDFIEIASDGSFCVVPGANPNACLACKGSGSDPDDPGEWVEEAGMHMPTSPCPDCNGSGKRSQQGEAQ